MALLRPLDKLPTLDVATILLLGAEETPLEQLGMAIIKECEGTAKVQVHVASCLPLPTDRECFRPRIDLIVFVLSLHSKYRCLPVGLQLFKAKLKGSWEASLLPASWHLRTVEASLPHVDARFFLGKVCFLVTGVRKEPNTSIHMDTVQKMATAYHSPLLFGDLEVESFRASVAQRLIQILQICAGHVPGLSALNLLSMMKPCLELTTQET